MEASSSSKKTYFPLSSHDNRPPLIRNASSIRIRSQEVAAGGLNEGGNRVRSRSTSNSTSKTNTSLIISSNNVILPTIAASASTSFESIRSNNNNLNLEGKEGEGEGLSPVIESEFNLNLSSAGGSNNNQVEEEVVGSSLNVYSSHRKEMRRGKSFTSIRISSGNTPTLEKEQPYYPPSLDSDGPTPSLPSISTKSLKDFIPQLLFLLGLFLSSFFLLLVLLSTLPSLTLPHSITDLPPLITSLSTYSSSSSYASIHLLLILSFLYLFKQIFSIPGSILTNILFGALYGTTWGTILSCLGTGVGSVGAYLISSLISPLVENYFSSALISTRRTLSLPLPLSSSSSSSSSSPPFPPSIPVPSSSNSNLFSSLLLARFFPLIPYSLLNIASGVLGLDLKIFFWTVVLGSGPFNFVTVSIGSLITTTTTTTLGTTGGGEGGPIVIWSQEVLIKLIWVTSISLIPFLFKQKIIKLLTSTQLERGLSSIGSVYESGKEWIRVQSWTLLSRGRILRLSFPLTTFTTRGGGGGGGEGRRKSNKSWMSEVIPEIVRRGSGSEMEEEGPILC